MSAHQAKNSQQLTDIIAQRFSESMLSMVAGITGERRILAEQPRQHLLVTRLPKAPFFTLTVLNLLRALLGMALATIALASHSKKTRIIPARLTIRGLVAALLEAKALGVALENGRSNSGVEAAFAEDFNDGKNDDDCKVLVDNGSANHVFEEISLEAATTNDESQVTVRPEPAVRLCDTHY